MLIIFPSSSFEADGTIGLAMAKLPYQLSTAIVTGLLLALIQKFVLQKFWNILEHSGTIFAHHESLFIGLSFFNFPPAIGHHQDSKSLLDSTKAIRATT